MESDIHQYDRKIELLMVRISKAKLDDESKYLIRGYERDLLLVENLSLPRRERLVSVILYLTKTHFKKPLKEVTVEDIKVTLSDIEKHTYSPWTRALYKIAIKKFFRWLKYGSKNLDKYPPLVSWIKVHVKRKDQPRVQASAILTEEEAHQLIETAEPGRDRAFVSILYELGSRIGEVGNLTVKDLTRDKYSYVVDLFGKTGHRTPRIVLADPHVTEWINHHPLRNNPDAPLWVVKDKNGKFVKMKYNSLRMMLKRIVKKSGITKRVYPHLFRHSRVTHLLGNHQINESQCKVFFGWSPESGMLSEYSHLVSNDVNEAILRINGIHVEKKEVKEATEHCPRCKKINSSTAKFCIYCSSILNEKTAFEHDEEEKQVDTVLNELLKDKRVREILIQKIAELGAGKMAVADK